MDKDKNPMPEFHLFPRATRLAHFLLDHLRDPGLSDHNTGSGPALDRALYDKPAIPQVLLDMNQMTLPYEEAGE